MSRVAAGVGSGLTIGRPIVPECTRDTTPPVSILTADVTATFGRRPMRRHARAGVVGTNPAGRLVAGRPDEAW